MPKMLTGVYFVAEYKITLRVTPGVHYRKNVDKNHPKVTERERTFSQSEG